MASTGAVCASRSTFEPPVIWAPAGALGVAGAWALFLGLRSLQLPDGAGLIVCTVRAPSSAAGQHTLAPGVPRPRLSPVAAGLRLAGAVPAVDLALSDVGLAWPSTRRTPGAMLPCSPPRAPLAGLSVLAPLGPTARVVDAAVAWATACVSCSPSTRKPTSRALVESAAAVLWVAMPLAQGAARVRRADIWSLRLVGLTRCLLFFSGPKACRVPRRKRRCNSSPCLDGQPRIRARDLSPPRSTPAPMAAGLAVPATVFAAGSQPLIERGKPWMSSRSSHFFQERQVHPIASRWAASTCTTRNELSSCGVGSARRFASKHVVVGGDGFCQWATCETDVCRHGSAQGLVRVDWILARTGVPLLRRRPGVARAAPTQPNTRPPPAARQPGPASRVLSPGGAAPLVDPGS